MPRLKIFDPTMLAREISERPLKAAVAVTKNSGADVPMATMVNPMTSSEIPNFLAMADAASTVPLGAPPKERAAEYEKAEL